MKNPKISIIVPVYNTQPWLTDCLDSVLRQTMDDFEVICVDDGSTDGSGLILQEYAAKDSRVLIISQSNQGVSAARNKGLEAARGEYIYFLDSDDYIESDLLETACRELDSKNLDLVFFDTHVFGERGIKQSEIDKRVTYYTMRGDYSEVSTGEDLLCHFLDNGDFNCSVCKQIVRKELLTVHHLRFYEGIINEDDLYTFQVILLAGRTAYIHRVFFHRRLRRNSTVMKPLGFQSPYGYYVCVIEAYRFLKQRNFNAEKKKRFLLLLKKWILIARDEYLQLERAERKQVELLPEPDKFLFNLFIADCTNREIQVKDNDNLLVREQRRTKERRGRLNGTIHKLILQNEKKDKKIKNLEKSRSYRIGRFLTFIPRKFQGGIRCWKQHGLVYTLKRCGEKICQFTRIRG